MARLGAHRGPRRLCRLHRAAPAWPSTGRPRATGAPRCSPATSGTAATEIITLSFWESREAIHGFAGDDIEQAVFYPEDDRYLVERETTVTHYEVVSGA